MNRRGYVIVHVPEHPRAFGRGWVYEHRLAVESKCGRLLACEEQVHHLNHVKHDNNLDNLFVCTEEEHRKAHDLCYAV